MPGNSTVDMVGIKSVHLKTTSHEKTRLTVCLVAMADGRKLQPLIVLKRKIMPQELKNLTDVSIALSVKSWINENLTKLGIVKVWRKLAFNQRMLV